MIYEYSLRNPGFSDILNGKKKIEGRLNKGTFCNIKINDKIIFYNIKNKITVTVTDIKYYSSFSDMLDNEILSLIRPNAKNINDSLELYRKYYSKENEINYGVIAFYIKLN